MMRPILAIVALLSAANLVAAQTTQAEVLKAVTIQVCPDLTSTTCNEISGGKISGFDTFECAANTDPLVIDCPAGTTFSGDVQVEEDLTVGNDISVGGNLTVEQKVFANELDVDVLEANEIITKDLDVTGTFTATGDVKLGDTDTMNLSVQGDLDVAGHTTLGDLDVKGEAQFQELKVNGDADVTGDLRVTGTAQFDQNVDVALDIVVAGDVAVGGQTTTDTLEVKGSAEVDGNLSVIGSITSKDGDFDALTTDNLTFDAATGDNLSVADVTSEKLTVTGSASIEALIATTGQFDEITASKLVVEGTSSLFYVEINDDLVQTNSANTALLQQTTVAGTLNVVGDATFRSSVTIDVDLHVKQDTTIDVDLNVMQDTTLQGTLNVGGDADFDSNVSIDGTLLVVKDASMGPTTVDGSLTVQGTSALLGDTVVGTVATPADMTVTGNLIAEGLAHFAMNLDVDGTLAVAQTITATDVTLTGSLKVGNDVTISENLNVMQDVDVGGSVTVAERVVVLSTTATSLLPMLSSTEATITEATITDATITNLDVTNSANINGDIDLTGDIDIGGNSLTVSATVEILNDVIFNDLTAANIQATSATINEVVANEGTFNILRGGDMTADVLTVTDLATLTDIEFTSTAAKILVPNTLEIFGHVTTTDFTADAGIFETTLLANEATLGTLQAKGAATFDAGLTVTGTFSGDTIVAADVTVSNTLVVQGTSTFEKDVQMDAALQVNGDATFSGTVTAQNLTVTNAATLDDLVVNGDFEANIALGNSFAVNAANPAGTCQLLSIVNTDVVIGGDPTDPDSADCDTGSNLLQGDNVVITGHAKISDLASPPAGTDYSLEVNSGTTTVTGRLEVNQADNDEVFRITSAVRETASRPLMSVGQDEFTVDVAKFEVVSIDPSGTLTGDFVNMQRFAQSELRSSFTMTHDNTIALSAEQVTVIGPLAVGGQDRSLTVQDANGLPPPFFVVCKQGTWEECNSKPEDVYFEVDRDGGIRIQPQLHLTSILKYLHRIGTQDAARLGAAGFIAATFPKPSALTDRKGTGFSYVPSSPNPTPATYEVAGGRRDVVLRPAFNNVNNAGGAYFYVSGSDMLLQQDVNHVQHLRMWLEPNRFAGSDFTAYTSAQRQQVNQENVGKVITIFGYEAPVTNSGVQLRGNQMLVSLFVDHMDAENFGDAASTLGGAQPGSTAATDCATDRGSHYPRFFDGESVFMVETRDETTTPGSFVSQTCGQELFIDSEFSASYASALPAQSNYAHEDFWLSPRFGDESVAVGVSCGSDDATIVNQPPLGLATRQDMFSVTLIMFADHVDTTSSASDAFAALSDDVLSFAVIGMSAVDISVPTDVVCRA